MKQYCDECASEKKAQVLADWEFAGDYLCNPHRIKLGYSASECKLISSVVNGVSTEEKQEKRTCSRPGYSKELRESNKSGRCAAHFYQPKHDKPNTESKIGLTYKTKAEDAYKPCVGKRVAMVPVNEAALDRFWERLGVEEKGAIFSSYLARLDAI